MSRTKDPRTAADLSTPPGLEVLGDPAAAFCADGSCSLPAPGTDPVAQRPA